MGYEYSYVDYRNSEAPKGTLTSLGSCSASPPEAVGPTRPDITSANFLCLFRSLRLPWKGNWT